MFNSICTVEQKKKLKKPKEKSEKKKNNFRFVCAAAAVNIFRKFTLKNPSRTNSMYLTQTPFWTQRVSMTEMHEFIYMREAALINTRHTLIHNNTKAHTQKPTDFFFELSNFEFSIHHNVIPNCNWNTLRVKEISEH